MSASGDAAAQARAARTQRLIRGTRLARYAMARRAPSPARRQEFDAVMGRLERGATADELVEAAAALEQAPATRQGRLW